MGRGCWGSALKCRWGRTQLPQKTATFLPSFPLYYANELPGATAALWSRDTVHSKAEPSSERLAWLLLMLREQEGCPSFDVLLSYKEKHISVYFTPLLSWALMSAGKLRHFFPVHGSSCYTDQEVSKTSRATRELTLPQQSSRTIVPSTVGINPDSIPRPQLLDHQILQAAYRASQLSLRAAAWEPLQCQRLTVSLHFPLC